MIIIIIWWWLWCFYIHGHSNKTAVYNKKNKQNGSLEYNIITSFFKKEFQEKKYFKR